MVVVPPQLLTQFVIIVVGEGNTPVIGKAVGGALVCVVPVGVAPVCEV